MIYLDWAATSPPDPEILTEAARVAAERFGNPSSRHALGAEAKAALEEARGRLAQAIGGVGGRVAFTSGGTESDGIPLLSLLRSALGARRDGSIKRTHLIVSEIEHAAVYEEALLLRSLGLDVAFVPPGADGRLDPAKIGAAVEKETALVAVMAVNNETGAVQPIAAIAAAIADAAGALGKIPPRLHVDAVQALGKVRFDPGSAGASSAAFSAHKLRGPRGVGALWTAGPLLTAGSAPGATRSWTRGAPPGGLAPLEPLVTGGGQESALRPGTENLQGAWAFAAAATSAMDDFAGRTARARALESMLLAGLASIPGALALPLGRQAGDERYSPWILSAAFPGLPGEVLARALSDLGIAVSTGAACSANAKRRGRRIMAAMGLPEALAASAIRISTGDLSTGADIDGFLAAAESAYRRLKT